MTSLAAGFRALGHGKLILLLTVATVLIGIGGAAPLRPVLERDLGGTLAGDHVVLNAPTDAPSDVIDFVRENAGSLMGVRRGSWFGFLMSLGLQMIFAGGIVVVLGRGRFTFGQFFEPARRNLGHNVKCFFLFVITLALVYGIVFGAAFGIAKKLFEDVPPDAAGRTLWDWGLRIVAILIWGVLSLLYDFARAARRYSPTIGAWRAYGFARRALRGSWIRALVLFGLWLVVGGAVWFALFSLAWSMTAVSVLAILVLFLVQLLVLGARSAIRVAAWGSYLEFLDHRAPRALAPRPRSGYAAAAPALQFR